MSSIPYVYDKSVANKSFNILCDIRHQTKQMTPDQIFRYASGKITDPDLKNDLFDINKNMSLHAIIRFIEENYEHFDEQFEYNISNDLSAQIHKFIKILYYAYSRFF